MMLKGITRLISRIHKLDPGRFLHMGTQARQSIAAHLDNQVPVESPRAISRTNENDPAKHGDQHEGQHYNISPQDLETVFPHGLPPRFVMQVKTFSEACLMDWLILHIPDAHLWVKNCRDLLQSSYNKQRFDQPLEASTWLKNFKTTNERFLNQGITRVRNATDAVGIVLKELKRQSSLGMF
ncbi:death associated protein 3, partial [Homo sapiens]